jgi:hypothetical protein
MRQPFVCKIAYPIEDMIEDSFFYTYGYLIPVSDMDEVEAVLITPRGERIPGLRQLSFPPYDWCFLFGEAPLHESCKLVVAARDAIGRTSRDVTHVVLSPRTRDITIVISSPPGAPSPCAVSAGMPFATWGTISDKNQVNNMAANIDCGGTVVPGTPVAAIPPYDWKFNFLIPANLSGDATLTVSLAHSNNPTRDLSIS